MALRVARLLNPTILTINAIPRISWENGNSSMTVTFVDDSATYQVSVSVMVAVVEALSSWITTTWENLPAEVEIRDPTNATVQVGSLQELCSDIDSA